MQYHFLHVSKTHYHDGTTLKQPPWTILRITAPIIFHSRKCNEELQGLHIELLFDRSCKFHMVLEGCKGWCRITDFLPSTIADSHSEASRTTHRTKITQEFSLSFLILPYVSFAPCRDRKKYAKIFKK